jgi:hypothetical protein
VGQYPSVAKILGNGDLLEKIVSGAGELHYLL